MIRDDRYGCRSLVCDANGIIIAEMVHRCMICAHISESINDARQHYQQRHFESTEQDSSSDGQRNGNGIEEEDDDEDDLVPHDDDDDDDDADVEFGHHHPSSSNSVIHSAASSNHGRPETGAGDQNGENGGGNSSRGGYVTCAVCNVVKFYASVQRRYGQFTCMGCAKFFGRFLLKPKRFYCPYLGSCPLDVSPRCKACLLQACTKTYILDERRKAVAEANRPIKRVAPASTTTVATVQSNQRPTVNPVRTAIQRKFSQIKKTAVQTAVRSTSTTTSSGRTVSSSTGVPVLRKQWGCKKCPGCLIEDCGKCNYCLDKPKFGGPNTLKKKCINRRCHAFNAGSKASSTATNNNSSILSKTN